jgi:diguanylate cyclase (GGDEF)-like protein
MNKDGKDIKNKLEGLRAAFALQIPERIRQIEELWHSLQGNAWEGKTAADMLRMTHMLAGSAASFGYGSLSSVARSLEAVLKDIVEKGDVPDESVRTSIAASLGKMKLSCDKGEAWTATEASAEFSAGTEVLVEGGERKTVFLVEDDTVLLESLALQIGHFGYEVRTFSEISCFSREIASANPSAIIMDMMFPEGIFAGAEALSGVRKEGEETIPIIFISSKSDFHTRLHAVRAGADAFFVKPLNIGALMDKLDALTRKDVMEPYRILVIDDDIALAEYYAVLLQQAGMETAVVTEPFQVMSHLISFNPDLILMDIYMPACNGFELAKVIRDMDTYVSIPIVFLSGETNVRKQMTAMRMGGDDFLTKPIQPEHLISSVTIRAERMRIIRSFMDRDGLTGLLNHTKTKEQLDIAIERTKRQGGMLSFAMLDIDWFKSVNDTYGHQVGDRVILSLARLLQQRLRKSDIVGRYGGEEFAVILSDTDLTNAFRVLDDVRSSFSRIRHQSEQGELMVTFSCGISSFPQYGAATLLNNMSDKALYEAKRGGRNRIVVK